MLAIIGDAERSARQHRVGLAGTIRGKHGCMRYTNGIHDGGQKIKDADIQSDLLARMVVSQEL